MNAFFFYDICHLLLHRLNVQPRDCESGSDQVSMSAATRAHTPPTLKRLIKLASSPFVTFSLPLSDADLPLTGSPAVAVSVRLRLGGDKAA